MNAASIALYVGVHYVKHPGLVSEATRTFEDTQELFLYVENICDSKKNILESWPCLCFFLALIFLVLLVTIFCTNHSCATMQGVGEKINVTQQGTFKLLNIISISTKQLYISH